MLNKAQKKLMVKIYAYAVGGFHRLNATTADCYEFTFGKKGDKHMDGTTEKADDLDWEGGWDWTSHLLSLAGYEGNGWLILLDAYHYECGSCENSDDHPLQRNDKWQESFFCSKCGYEVVPK